jgi:hypothetical protein
MHGVAGLAWDIVVNDGAGSDDGFSLKALCPGDGDVVSTGAGLWCVWWCRYPHPTNLSV